MGRHHQLTMADVMPPFRRRGTWRVESDNLEVIWLHRWPVQDPSSGLPDIKMPPAMYPPRQLPWGLWLPLTEVPMTPVISLNPHAGLLGLGALDSFHR